MGVKPIQLSDLPPEMLTAVFHHCLSGGANAISCLDQQSRAIVELLFRTQMKELERNASLIRGPVEIIIPNNPPYASLFKEWIASFLHYKIEIPPNRVLLTLDDLQNFQAQANLQQIWPAVRMQLPFRPECITPKEIKAWMENVENAPILNSITHLDLSNLGLRSLPPEISKLTQLKTLLLSGNQLTCYPEEINSFKHLQILDLRNNFLTQLPPTIRSFQSLTTLYLDNNQLTELPTALGDLRQLQMLSAANNGLKSLPHSLKNLHNLSNLFLHYNQLSQLPDLFGNFPSLTWLSLNHNQLMTLPSSLAGLLNLEELSLEGNPFFIHLPLEILHSELPIFKDNPILSSYTDQPAMPSTP